MSIQEEKFMAIANAIREKDGTTAPISANEFAARILAIQAGSGSDFAVPLIVSTAAGALITAVNGGIAVSGTAGEDGTATLTLTAPGEWVVTASLDGDTNTVNVTVTDGYTIEIALGSRLPGGYTEVEYIQSDGSQYIDTGIKSSNTLKVQTDVSVLALSSTAKSFFGSYGRVGAGYVQFRVLAVNTNTLRFLVQGATVNKTLTASRHLIGIDALNSCVILDSYTTEYTPTASNYADLSIYLFAYNSSGSASQLNNIKMYSCQMVDNGMPIRDFVPCINSAGEAGLYDMIEGKFYGNLGTGKFTAGPAV